jgi:predicted phosphodiesterase
MNKQPKGYSSDEYIADLFSLDLDELQEKYMKPKDMRSLLALRRYYAKKQAPAQVLQETLEEQFITKARPTVIRASKVKKPIRTDKLTICLGDAQIGYRGDEPFHDEAALAMAQVAIRVLQPDNIVFTGDMIDLPAMSKYEQRRDWADTTQRAIDRYHAFLAQTRANAPHAEIVVVHGNHEARLDTFIRRDASVLLGIRRANAERELSVLNLQYLTRYDELDVQSVDGYPNAAYWLEDNLKVTHGTNVAKGGSNAAKYLREESESVIYGHTHRMEVAYRTLATRNGQRTIAASSPGCLARTDGFVPGFNYSVDNQGRTVPKAEDWQQGLLIIHHNPTSHDIQPVRITEHGMRLGDKFYPRSDYV